MLIQSLAYGVWQGLDDSEDCGNAQQLNGLIIHDSSLGSLTHIFLFKLSAVQSLHWCTQYIIQTLAYTSSVA
jgi:hypothetical protein